MSICSTLTVSKMAKIEIPTKEDATQEARLLCMKLLLSEDRFTIVDMSRLSEILTNEGLLK